MFTVQEIAAKLNITTQSVYNKINASMKEELQEHCKEVKRGNRTVRVVTEQGVELIAKSLETPVVTNNARDMQGVDNDLYGVLKATIETLTLQLDTKDRQLDAKDLQIKDLNKVIEGLQESNKNTQILLHREQETKMLEETTTEKKGFIANLFNKS